MGEDACKDADEDITKCIDEGQEEFLFVIIEKGVIEGMNKCDANSASDGSFKGGAEV